MKKLSEYAKEHNITYRTAHNHFKKGLIDGAYQLPTGTIIVPDNKLTNDYLLKHMEKLIKELKDDLIKELKND
jgi:predicted site-specific integrase-resolvase